MLLDEPQFVKEMVTARAHIKIEMIKIPVEGEKELNPYVEIFTNKVYIYRLVAVSFIGSSIYSIFYGLSTDVGSLGISNISIAGILLGLTQSFGYLLVIPFVHNMKRVLWVTIFQIILACSALLLLGLSLLPKSSTISTI